MSLRIVGRQEAHGPARPWTEKVGPSMDKNLRPRPVHGRVGPAHMPMGHVNV